MTTYATGNPVPSTEVKDLYDNAQNLDTLVNDRTKLTHPDRLGVPRKTWFGVETQAQLDIAEAVAQATAEADAARDEAQEARNDAVAAAGAIGPIKFYPTKAAATADLPNLENDDLVEVAQDESRGGSRIRYRVSDGALVFEVNLDQLRQDLAGQNGAEIVGSGNKSVAASLALTSGALVVNVDLEYDGDAVAAYNAIPESGNVILLFGNRDYNILSLGSNSKPNVSFRGAKMPRYDPVQKRLIGGTVLQGSIYNTAKGFKVENLGIDRGEWVRQNLANNQYKDTFVNVDFGSDAGISYGDLIILQSEVVSGLSASQTHCLLNERGSGVFQTGDVTVIEGYHGHVVKVQNFYGAGKVTITKHQQGTGVIVKGDPPPANPVSNVFFGHVIIDGTQTRKSAGVLYEAQQQNMVSVGFESIVGKYASYLIVEAAATTGLVVNLTIGYISGEVIDGDMGGIAEAVVIGPHTINARIGDHSLSFCKKGGLRVMAGAIGAQIGNGVSKGAEGVGSQAGNGYTFDADVQHGFIQAFDNAGYGVANNANNSINPQNIFCANNSLGGVSKDSFVLVNGVGWDVAKPNGSAIISGRRIDINLRLTGGTISTTGYGWTTVAKLAKLPPPQEIFLNVFSFANSGAPLPAAAKIMPNGDVLVYSSSTLAPIAFEISGSFTTLENS